MVCLFKLKEEDKQEQSTKKFLDPVVTNVLYT